MKDFTGRIAVITGGGTGMGRELARQLVAEGCNVAMCDVSASNMASTRTLCEADAAQGTRVTTFVADVSDEAAMEAFRAAVARDQETDRIHLLINNAGIGGGGGFVTGDRGDWERTFNICWGGVYNGCRAFLPMLMAADEGHIVNTSSINGFWASLGPNVSHTAYAAAKFAVKGFTEALITDLRLNAPHIRCSVVMPGHIGTEIVANSRRVLTGAAADDAQVQAFVDGLSRRFHDDAPTTAAEAARVILEGVKAGRWRILVGDDAQALDERVRADPEGAYEVEFFERFANEVGWRLSV
jgi:NAD(P)-dependent dehydrogenase (short-subunit alcohol dehydrogenase family)